MAAFADQIGVDRIGLRTTSSFNFDPLFTKSFIIHRQATFYINNAHAGLDHTGKGQRIMMGKYAG
jgi:hypothetical protein